MCLSVLCWVHKPPKSAPTFLGTLTLACWRIDLLFPTVNLLPREPQSGQAAGSTAQPHVALLVFMKALPVNLRREVFVYPGARLQDICEEAERRLSYGNPYDAMRLLGYADPRLAIHPAIAAASAAAAARDSLAHPSTSHQTSADDWRPPTVKPDPEGPYMGGYQSPDLLNTLKAPEGGPRPTNDTAAGGDLARMQRQLDELHTALKQSRHNGRAQGDMRSRAPRREFLDHRDVTCFECGKKGHFRRECRSWREPRFAARSRGSRAPPRKRARTRSPAPDRSMSAPIRPAERLNLSGGRYQGK